jgi:cytidylate kinase
VIAMTARSNQSASADTAKETPVSENKSDQAVATEPTEEQLAALDELINARVEAALQEKVAAAVAEATKGAKAEKPGVVAEGEPTGTVLLPKSAFVPIWDKDGNELPAVPKHWTADQLPLGATKKKPAESDKD